MQKLLEYRNKYCERCYHDFNWLKKQMITLINCFNTKLNTHSTINTECCTATPLSSSPEAMKEGHQDMAAFKIE